MVNVRCFDRSRTANVTKGFRSGVFPFLNVDAGSVRLSESAESLSFAADKTMPRRLFEQHQFQSAHTAFVKRKYPVPFRSVDLPQGIVGDVVHPGNVGFVRLVLGYTDPAIGKVYAVPSH